MNWKGEWINLKEDETFDGSGLFAFFIGSSLIAFVCLFCLVSMIRGDIEYGFEKAEFSRNVIRGELTNRIDRNDRKSDMLMYVEEQQFLKSLR